MSRKMIPTKLCLAALALSLSLAAVGCGTGREGLEQAYDVFGTTDAYADHDALLIGTAGNYESAGLFASDLCVGGILNSEEGFATEDYAQTEALFVIGESGVAYAKNIYEKQYPASTTKILTAYVALKYGDPDQLITVSDTALSDIEYDSSVCGIKPGDRLTLRDLLYGMMLESGNDAANAIAEAVGGSRDAFVEMMNSEAAQLGATCSHFVNPHGLHDEDHYTTAYDLYLIFRAALQNEDFVDIISTDHYDVTYVNSEGETVEKEWNNTNGYLTGEYDVPDGVTVIGGKTGTTVAAGSCLVLYSTNAEGSPVISVVMNAGNHDQLYACMSDLLGFSD